MNRNEVSVLWMFYAILELSVQRHITRCGCICRSISRKCTHKLMWSATSSNCAPPTPRLVGISYAVSAENPQLCPGARHGRQPTRCRCDSAPPHFTLERAICPQRPGVVWLLSTTMYFSSLEVTSFACVCVLRTLFPYVCRTQSLVCAALFKARRGTVASCFASVIPSVSP